MNHETPAQQAGREHYKTAFQAFSLAETAFERGQPRVHQKALQKLWEEAFWMGAAAHAMNQERRQQRLMQLVERRKHQGKR
jgi:hypothetical protein